MKYLINILLLFGILLTWGCESELNQIFPEDRLSEGERLEQIENILTSSEYGWKFILKPADNSLGGYNMVVDFDTDGMCRMVADYIQSNASFGEEIFDASKVQENICYSVKNVSNFELSFETYSFLHHLYDKYVLREFKFRIQSYSESEVVLYDGASKMIMTKATSDDWNVSRFMITELRFKEFTENATLFSYLHKGEDPKLQISISTQYRSINFFYFDENKQLQNQSVGYHYTVDGIILNYPLEVPGMEPFEKITFGTIEDGEGSSNILNVVLDEEHPSQFYSSVRTMVPVDDGVEHFLKVEGVSVSKGGRFWSSRKKYEGGFNYGSEYTYFGLENDEYFSEFSVYLGYYNAKLNDTYNFFSFVFMGDGIPYYYDVYFLYETIGSDQIVFRLDEEKGQGGYSSGVNPYVKAKIEAMVNKMIQPEGYTLVSSPYANPIDGSLSIFLVDNKDYGYMYMRTGDFH